MANMTVQRLHDLFEENPDQNLLSWQGTCHDCGGAVQVTAVPKADGIHINDRKVFDSSIG